MSWEQVALQIGLAAGVGFITSILSKLATSAKWDNRRLGYTVGISIFSSLAVIQGLAQDVTESNFVTVLLAMFGANFVANKGIQMASRAVKKQ